MSGATTGGSGKLDRLVGAGVVLVLVVTAIYIGGATPVDDDASARNSHERGRRGVLRLFQELGFSARVFDGAPGALPGERSLLWMPQVPAFAGSGSLDQGETVDEEQADDEGPEGAVASELDPGTPPGAVSVLGHLHRPKRYGDYLQAGGSLVIADGKDARRFLGEGLALTPVPALTPPATASSRGQTLRASLPSGEVLSLASEGWASRSAAPSGPGGAGWQPWLTAEDGTPLILRLPVPSSDAALSNGSVFLLGSAAWLANDSIGREEHGLLAVRLAEAAVGAAPATILFDEYALGGWRPRSKGSLAFAPASRALTLALLAALAIFVWRLAWPREFPRDPKPLDTISPLARARAQAALLERAGRLDLLAPHAQATDVLSGPR